MKKRILIPTDFSKNAFNAIQYAMELFKREKCEFFILNTYYHSGFNRDNFLIPEPSDAEMAKVRENAENKMQRLKQQMDKYEKNELHDFHFISRFGSFFDYLKEAVKKKEIHLIIMGTQGQTDDKTVILGSNAVNVMEKIRSCPVLAIPAQVVYKDPNEIVFPTSFRNHYQEKELAILAEISRHTQAPIRILHIQKGKSLSKEQEKNKAHLEEILASAQFTHHRLFEIDLQDGVRSFVQSRESEMIAIINKKHNFFGSIFSNPMVKELGMHTTIPLLAMHDSRA